MSPTLYVSLEALTPEVILEALTLGWTIVLRYDWTGPNWVLVE